MCIKTKILTILIFNFAVWNVMKRMKNEENSYQKDFVIPILLCCDMDNVVCVVI